MASQSVLATRDAFTAGRDIYLGGGDGAPQGVDAAIAIQHDATYSYSRRRVIFMQYLNPEILSCYGIASTRETLATVLRNAVHATRLALLATDEFLVFPASYFAEVPCLPDFLRETEALLPAGQIRYSSYTNDLDAYFEQKALEYRADAVNPYLSPPRRPRGIVFSPRFAGSTASDIGMDWRDALGPKGFLEPVVNNLHKRWPRGAGDVEQSLACIPERLDGQAFVGRFVRDALPVRLRRDEHLRVDMFVSRAYLASYLRDHNAMIIGDFPFGDLSCGVARLGDEFEGRTLSARRFDLALTWLGLYDFVYHHGTWEEIVSMRSTPEFATVAVAMHHLCPSEPFRRVATRARRRVKSDSATTMGEALAIAARVAKEIERTPHFHV